MGLHANQIIYDVNSQTTAALPSRNAAIAEKLANRGPSGSVSGTCPAGEYYAGVMYIGNGYSTAKPQPAPYNIASSSVSGVTSSELVSTGLMAIYKIKNTSASTCTFYVTTGTTSWDDVYGDTVSFRFY